MSNDYRYIDPDYVYTNPLTGVLRNLAGIQDQAQLTFLESASVTRRSNELRENPISVRDSASLFAIHHRDS